LIFDKEYIGSLSVGGAFAAGYVAGTTGDPRTYGATLRLQF
jgi:outer membrane receptor protein involved in Fe transport